MKIKDRIIEFISATTDPLTLEEVSTQDVASAFMISTKEAYRILQDCAKDKLIRKLDPVNEHKFECCGWIKNKI